MNDMTQQNDMICEDRKPPLFIGSPSNSRPNTTGSYPGSRVIGHIYNVKNKLLRHNKNKFASELESQNKPLLSFRQNSNVSPTNPGSGPEQPLNGEGDTVYQNRSSMHSLSSTVPLEPRFNASQPLQKPGRRHGSVTLYDKNNNADVLPMVYTDENANSNVHNLMLPLSSRQKHSQHNIFSAVTRNQHRLLRSPGCSPIQQINNSLSISGIKQEQKNPDTEENGSKSKEPPFEEAVVNSSMNSKPPTPNSSLIASSNYPRKSQKVQSKSNISKPSAEPVYADPIAGSSMSFQSRLAELASLEAETVRWERMRKQKKKVKDDC